jgi:hypothetical protein
MGNCWCHDAIDDYEIPPQEQCGKDNNATTTCEEGNGEELRPISYHVGDTLIVKNKHGNVLLNVCVKSINVKEQTMVVTYPSQDFVSMQERTIGVFSSCIVNRDKIPEPTEVKAFPPEQVAELVLTRFQVENKGFWKHGNWMKLTRLKQCGQVPSSVSNVNLELDKLCAKLPYHLGMFFVGKTLKDEIEWWGKIKGYDGHTFEMPFKDWEDAYVCLCLKKL